jgi:hypothetical protein
MVFPILRALLCGAGSPSQSGSGLGQVSDLAVDNLLLPGYRISQCHLRLGTLDRTLKAEPEN